MNDLESSNSPIRVMFLVTSMPVGGAETLLVNLVRRMDRRRFLPEVACLKQRGPLGEELAEEMPVHHELTAGKLDPRVLARLVRLLKEREIDAVVTVGAGDKMFWGRLAARIAGVPVIASALHSTGWPDGVGRLNRLLTPITDAFIGVAKPHGKHLVENERFPAERVHVIPNGVDTHRFAPPVDTPHLYEELGIDPTTPLVGILAALRPEKNHELFLSATAEVKKRVGDAQFVVIGDGPQGGLLKQMAVDLEVSESVHFLGSRSDVPELLGALNVFALTSHNEANPVSILEAMSVGKPVVATDVGSVHETVADGVTGYLAAPGDEQAIANRITELLEDPLLSQEMGARGRRVVEENWSLDTMVAGYERLLLSLYQEKTCREPAIPAPEPSEAEPQEAGAAHS